MNTMVDSSRWTGINGFNHQGCHGWRGGKMLREQGHVTGVKENWENHLKVGMK